MKFLILSDIHGSASSLRSVFETVHSNPKFTFDKIILLGDFLNHGARNKLPEGYAPPEVVQLLNPLAHQIIAVRGNCDGDVDGMLFNFPCNAPYGYITMEQFKNHQILITHGHLIDVSTAAGAAKAGLKLGDVLLSGHTHLAGIKWLESGVINVNPGSISLPRAKQAPSFGFLDEEGFAIYSVPGELMVRWVFNEAGELQPA